jgi:hypothetical protein
VRRRREGEGGRKGAVLTATRTQLAPSVLDVDVDVDHVHNVESLTSAPTSLLSVVTFLCFGVRNAKALAKSLTFCFHSSDSLSKATCTIH